MQSTKSKIFIVWPITDKVCQVLFWNISYILIASEPTSPLPFTMHPGRGLYKHGTVPALRSLLLWACSLLLW